VQLPPGILFLAEGVLVQSYMSNQTVFSAASMSACTYCPASLQESHPAVKPAVLIVLCSINLPLWLLCCVPQMQWDIIAGVSVGFMVVPQGMS